jgi:hypothetical protein
VAINRRFIFCSPEDVFAVLSTGWLYPSWVVGASRMRKVEPAWPAVSASIHHSVGVWPLLINDTTTILEWDPPAHVLFKARGWPAGSAHVALDVRRVERGCTVTMTEDAVEGPGRRLVPERVRSAAIVPRNKESLLRLAYLAEGHAGGS